MKFLLSICFVFIITLGFGQEKLQWVYIETETSQKGSIKNFYYYGQLTNAAYQKILNGDFDGNLLCIQNVHYLDDDDKIVPYADKTDNGTIVLQIRDLIIMVGKNHLPRNDDDTPTNQIGVNQEF